MPLKNPTINYEAQLRILAVANAVLQEQIEKLATERNQLKGSLERDSGTLKTDDSIKEIIEKEAKRSYPRQEMQMSWEKGRKRYRRSATEIERTYRCPYSPCDKAYG